MAKHVSARNFKHKTGKIKAANSDNWEVPTTKQFGSDSERLVRNRREKSGIIAAIIVGVAVVAAILSSVLK